MIHLVKNSLDAGRLPCRVVCSFVHSIKQSLGSTCRPCPGDERTVLNVTKDRVEYYIAVAQFVVVVRMAGLVRRSKDWQSSWQLAVTEIIIARPELAVGTGRSKSGSRVKRHQKLK